MIIKSELPKKSTKSIKLNYTNFINGINCVKNQNTLGYDQSPLTYNFCIDSGVLSTGLGIETLTFPTSTSSANITERTTSISSGYNIIGAWMFKKESTLTGISLEYYNDNAIIFLTDNYKTYLMPSNFAYDLPIEISDGVLSEIPVCIPYDFQSEQSLLFASKSGMWYVKRIGLKDMVKVQNAPYIKKMCIHNQRVFATTINLRDEIWFSNSLNPTDWDVTNNAGIIKLDNEFGVANNVISFDDYLYIFADYGIYKLYAPANLTDFELEKLNLSIGKIYGESVRVCGDKIIMLTSIGLVEFDGSKIKKINNNFISLFDKSKNNKISSAFLDGKYYVSGYLNYNDQQSVGCEQYDQFYNNTLVEYDTQTAVINIMRGADISMLSVYQDELSSKLMICFDLDGVPKLGQLSRCGSIFGQSLSKKWTSPLCDLGYTGQNKIIKNIDINTNVDMTIYVKTEHTKKEFNIYKGQNTARINTLMKGKKIAIDFETHQSECEISNPIVSIVV